MIDSQVLAFTLVAVDAQDLETAAALFYAEGLKGIGVDRIISEAGSTHVLMPAFKLALAGRGQRASQRKAQRVERGGFQYLVDQQIPAARMTARGYGETSPLSINGLRRGEPALT